MGTRGLPSRRLSDKAVAGRIVAVVAAIVVVLIFLVHWGTGGNGDRQSPSSGPPRKVWSPTPAQRVARDKAIADGQSRDIFGDIRVANQVGRLVVRPIFYLATFKEKELMANVAMGWCLDRDPDCKVLILQDSMTNKEVGRYADVYGGLEMD